MRRIFTLMFCLILSLSPLSAQNDVATTNEVYFKELMKQTYGATGNVRYWANTARYIAFMSASQLTSVAITINSEKDHGSEKAQKFKQIVEQNRKMIELAKELAFKGKGDVDFWLDRCRILATEIAMHTSRIAGLCDRKMLGVVSPKIEELLRKAKTAAFEGRPGDVDFWLGKCGGLATELIEILGNTNTELATQLAE